MTDLVRKRSALIVGADAMVAAGVLRERAEDLRRYASRRGVVSGPSARKMIDVAEICERVARELEDAR